MKTQIRIKHGAMIALAVTAFVVLPKLVAGPPPNGPHNGGNWTARNVTELIAAINTANAAGGMNTITLQCGKTFTLTAVNNTTDGPNGLPVIAANNKLTIRGNGATIARSKAPGTPAFRLFDVASGAALTLQNLTLANGLVIGDIGMNASGGAILNAAGATLTVKCSMFVGNQIVGGDGAGGLGGFGFGGAVCSDGNASFDAVVFCGNQATGGATTNPDPDHPDSSLGGLGWGGAINSQNDGNLTVRNCWFNGNKAVGGQRHQPSAQYDGAGVSGAVDSWGTALISESLFTDNRAIGATADEGVIGGYGMAGAVSNGGPLADSPECTIHNCMFRHNLAIGADTDSSSQGGQAVAGALSSGYSFGDAKITVTGCVFTDNQAIGGNGGVGGWAYHGVFNIESPFFGTATTVIAHSIFANNRAVGGAPAGVAEGGVIGNIDYNADGGAAAILTITDCKFTGNEALSAPGGDGINNTSIAQSGAVDTMGNTTILNSTFVNNRAVGAAMLPTARDTSVFYTASSGGALSSWDGTLEIRNSRFEGNQVVGGDGSLGGPGGMAMGGAITVFSGLPATIVNCSIAGNIAIGGDGAAGTQGGDGVGAGLNVGLFPYAWGFTGTNTAVTVTGTTISRNQAIGGSHGGAAMGGGYAVGVGVLFGFEDTSSVTLNGGSVVKNNKPDDAFHF